MSCKDGKGVMDNGKYVRYTPEQVEALERLYHDCPKPSSIRRQQLIRECPILSHIEPKQIKVWFQNRRCREKQRKEASRLQAVNRKLSAMNKLLMEENDRLQKQVSHLVYENGYFRQHSQNTTLATKDTSCDSAVTSGQRSLTAQHPPRDASPAGLLSIAEETLAEFLSKATGTAVEWVQMPGMKPGPESIGIVAISHGCPGVAARACGLVGLEPTRVAEILKDRPSWYRDCRAVDILNVLPTANGGTIELLYMQLYAPTTLAPARDLWLLRYTSVLEDGSLVICERSLKNTQNGPSMPPVQHFVRAEMLPSGYLIRPCEGGGSIIHIVDHMDLEPWSVPEVLRPLYESSTMLAQKTTMVALRHLRQISHEVSQSNVTGWGRRPAALRALGQRLSRGFNEALNGFTDEGWSMIGNDGVDDVTILVNSSPDKLMGLNLSFANGFPSVSNAVLCAKASMLLQNVPPAILLRFLREHRSEWADNNMDAYSAAAIKVGPCSFSGSRVGNYGGQVILPLAHTIEHEEFLEVIKLEGIAHSPEDAIMPREVFLLQLCNGMDENAVGTCAELIFAPIDASFADDAPLLPSGFRIIPLDSGKEVANNPNRTLDLTSALDIGPAGNKASNDYSGNSGCMRSVMTIAFEFAFESHMQDHVASMARQYVRSIISSVQRVALALSPSNLNSQAWLRTPLGTPEAQTLARWISNSYRCFLGAELLKSNNEGSESLLKSLWHHTDAILCCTLKALPVFTFANQAGLDMLETTLVALQDIALEKIFDDHGRKILCSEFPLIIQQGFACLQGGLCLSSMGRPISYERVVAWKIEKNRGEKGGFGPLTSMGSGRIENSFSDMSISSSGTGFGSVSGFGLTTTDIDSFSTKPKGRPTASANAPPKGLGMKLGKSQKTNQFLESLKAEGEVILEVVQPKLGPSRSAAPPLTDPITLTVEEKLNVTLKRDGGVSNFDVQGTLSLQILNQEDGHIQVQVQTGNNQAVSFKTHPNMNKELFANEYILGLKDPNRPFPTGQASDAGGVGLLKWRLQSTDESMVPLTINCWPSSSGNETYVNIEHEASSMFDLRNVVISVPLPALREAPSVSQIDGEWRYDSRNSILEWSVLLIDNSNRSGSLEFVVPQVDASAFFPISVHFMATDTFSDLKVTNIIPLKGGNPPKYAQRTQLLTENYQVV